jgi:hypothetical protein
MPYSSGPGEGRGGGHTPPLPEVNFIMVEMSYLFIKQDQMILTCNSAVASLMLSRFYENYIS